MLYKNEKIKEDINKKKNIHRENRETCKKKLNKKITLKNYLNLKFNTFRGIKKLFLEISLGVCFLLFIDAI